ncbi:hypothetical protein HY404_03745 [Candidatus Microgenomates bacterium]|nr:hypothetical protein [Candidatus Microgenomates bacterium]
MEISQADEAMQKGHQKLVETIFGEEKPDISQEQLDQALDILREKQPERYQVLSNFFGLECPKIYPTSRPEEDVINMHNKLVTRSLRTLRRILENSTTSLPQS